ncbi:hypothetical protein [Ochrobactrum sp. 3-3]|uniref:hypothetical protein n=1 Tax=Ochrobactrum sp. 3-3 TaxID=1830124 RepID=UPI000DEF8778|nr:hypothetical protein [Ochrobactrum sp. 3-3]
MSLSSDGVVRRMALSFHEGGRLKQDINLMRYPIGADGKLHEGDDGALYFRASREYGTAHSKVSSSVAIGRFGRLCVCAGRLVRERFVLQYR